MKHLSRLTACSLAAAAALLALAGSGCATKPETTGSHPNPPQQTDGKDRATTTGPHPSS